jgi:N-acetylmuramoyl-L-alanine amidase
MVRLVVGLMVAVGLVFGLALNVSPASAESPLTNKIIGLDPGHGGSDAGASFSYGKGIATLKEKDINLAVATELRKLLEADGAKVVMTRTSDTAVSLSGRCTIAANGKAQVLLSIHHNAVAKATTDGIETFYTQANDKAIAQATYDELTKTFALPKRGVKYSSDFVLTARPAMPSTITEAYFVSNSTQAQQFKGVALSEYKTMPVIQNEAKALYQALVTYFSR